MTNPSNTIRVNVAPGAGRIARRELALLFDPSGDNADLVASFDTAATDDDAITAVKQGLIDAEFQNAPLVLVDWRSNGLGLLVFGDVVVRSSTSAAPMISGAGSGTWIERHLGALELGDATEAQVWCDGDEAAAADAAAADDATDLRLGVIRGGGMKVVLTRDVEPPLAEIPPPEPEHNNPRPVPVSAPTSDSENVAVVAEPAPTSAPAAPTNGELTPVPESPFAPVTPSVTNGNGGGAPASVNGATSAPAAEPGVAAPSRLAPTEPEPVAPSGSVATAVDPFTKPATSAEAPDEIKGATFGLVEASLCANGHTNPPQHLICRVCAVEIDPDAAVELIAQPSVGHLRFADGDVVEVDGPRVIGRKPVSDDSATLPVTVDHAEVSRSHVEVAIEGWSVLVTDLGSRNGTWVIPPSDPTPIKLDADVPYLLEHGTTVHLGGPEASFTYDFGID